MIRWWDVGVPTRAPRVCMHLLVPGKSNYRVMNAARALVADGYTVTIVDVVPEVAAGCKVEMVQGILFRHLVAPDWFRPTRWKLWFIAKASVLVLRGTLALLLYRADVYHAHVEHTFFAACLAACFWRSRLVFDTPELTLYSPPFTTRPLVQKYTLYILRWLTFRCDLHLTGSPAYVPVLRTLYGDGWYRVIRHIPPQARCPLPRVPRFHERLHLPADVRIALYQGYLLPDRGLPELIRSAPYLNPGIVIVLLGLPFGTMADELQALIRSLHVEQRVKLLPPVPYEELLTWTAAADLGLLLLPPDYSLSIRKCLPNKFFEYISAGLPLLCSDLEVVAALVRRYGLGRVVTNLTPRQIALAINRLLAAHDHCRWMRDNALHLVRTQRLSWEMEQYHLLACYRDLLRRRPAPLLLRGTRKVSYGTADKLFQRDALDSGSV